MKIKIVYFKTQSPNRYFSVYSLEHRDLLSFVNYHLLMEKKYPSPLAFLKIHRLLIKYSKLRPPLA